MESFICPPLLLHLCPEAGTLGWHNSATLLLCHYHEHEKHGETLLLVSPFPVHASLTLGTSCSGGIRGRLPYSSHTCCEKHAYLFQNQLQSFAYILTFILYCCLNGIKVFICFISHGCCHDKYVKDSETFRYYTKRNNKRTYVNISICVTRIHVGGPYT